MEHDFEQNIKCPYCDYEDTDSWEFGTDSGKNTCGSCGEEFNVQVNVEVTYTTTRIDCEENDSKHDYKFESLFVSKENFENGIWNHLQETDWTYFRIMMCSICGDKDYIKITKEEYDTELITNP